jgi:hypothetical protein
MTNPLRLSKGEVSAGRFVSNDGYEFGDGTIQNTAMGLLTRYTPAFTATGLTYTGTGATHPCYESYYVKHLQMVNFQISVNLSTVTNFGTGQFKLELPFTPYGSFANHFNGWVWVDPTQAPDELNGHIAVTGDHLYGDKVLDLHWNQATTSNPKPVIEKLLSQGTPVTLTTASRIQISGSYISAE